MGRGRNGTDVLSVTYVRAGGCLTNGYILYFASIFIKDTRSDRRFAPCTRFRVLFPTLAGIFQGGLLNAQKASNKTSHRSHLHEHSDINIEMYQCTSLEVIVNIVCLFNFKNYLRSINFFNCNLYYNSQYCCNA